MRMTSPATRRVSRRAARRSGSGRSGGCCSRGGWPPCAPPSISKARRAPSGGGCLLLCAFYLFNVEFRGRAHGLCCLWAARFFRQLWSAAFPWPCDTPRVWRAKTVSGASTARKGLPKPMRSALRLHTPHEIDVASLHASQREEVIRALRSIGSDQAPQRSHQKPRHSACQSLSIIRPRRQQRCSRLREPIL